MSFIKKFRGGVIERDLEQGIRKLAKSCRNTQLPLKAKHKLVLTITFSPLDDERNAAVVYDIDYKLPNPTPLSSKMMLVDTNRGEQYIEVDKNNKADPAAIKLDKAVEYMELAAPAEQTKIGE